MESDKKFIKIGDKIVPIDSWCNGIPTIKATAEEIHYPDGRIDCVVKVPCLKLSKVIEEPKTTSEEIRYPDGRIDCIVRPPTLGMEGRMYNPN